MTFFDLVFFTVYGYNQASSIQDLCSIFNREYLDPNNFISKIEASPMYKHVVKKKIRVVDDIFPFT